MAIEKCLLLLDTRRCHCSPSRSSRSLYSDMVYTWWPRDTPWDFPACFSKLKGPLVKWIFIFTNGSSNFLLGTSFCLMLHASTENDTPEDHQALVSRRFSGEIWFGSSLSTRRTWNWTPCSEFSLDIVPLQLFQYCRGGGWSCMWSGPSLVSWARPFFLNARLGALKQGLVNYRYLFRSAVPRFWGPCWLHIKDR